MCSTVLLPAPFGPSSPVMPGETVNDMPLTATTFPYQRETSSSTIVASGVTSTPGETPQRQDELRAIVARAARK